MRCNKKRTLYVTLVFLISVNYYFLGYEMVFNHEFIGTTFNRRPKATVKVAVLIQAYGLNDPIIWDDLLGCVANVGKAKTMAENFHDYPWVGVEAPDLFSYDVFITYREQENFSTIKSKLVPLGPDKVYGTPILVNEGFDVKQFLTQLEFIEGLHPVNTTKYDLFLKIHSKSDMEWRQLTLESLCGSPSNVLSIIRTLAHKDDRKIGMIGPQGFMVQRYGSNLALIRPLRANNPFTNEFPFAGNIGFMALLYREMYNKDLDMQLDFVLAAGTMFWCRYDDFRVKDWMGLLPWMSTRWSKNYNNDYLIEHAIERLFSTIPYMNGVTIAEIGVAPKPIAIYFPQYHEIQENNQIHGKGFTEWTLLKPATNKNISKPLSVEEGGLGFYNLKDFQTRKKQAEMAKAAGIHGFMYYHYWFSGKTHINYSNPVMGTLPKLLLEDGEPNIPFMFCWANEPWTDKWGGLNDELIFLPQEYGSEVEWTKHFYYLLPFFKHPNYIRVDDKPVFIIYRIGDMKNILAAMVNLWNVLASQYGLKGIYFVYTLNNFLSFDAVFENSLHVPFDAAFHFYPTVKDAFRDKDLKSASWTDLPINSDQRQMWGAYTSFDNSLRRKQSPSLHHISPEQFSQELRHSFEQMLLMLPYSTKGKIHIPNLYFITAWNEWNEQAVLEPSDRNGFAYLSAVKNNLENQPIIVDRNNHYNPFFQISAAGGKRG